MAWPYTLSDLVAAINTNPVGTERLGGQSMTGPSPDTQPAASWGGYPVSQRLYNAGQGAIGNALGWVGGTDWTAFHGSPVKGLTELQPSDMGPSGAATYLTPATNVAKQYMRGQDGALYEVPYPDNLFHGSGTTWMPGDNVNPFQVWRDQTANVVNAAEPQHQAAISDMMGKMYQSDGYPFFVRLSQLLGGSDKAQALLKKAGYNGITGMVDGPEIGVFGNVKIPEGNIQ